LLEEPIRAIGARLHKVKLIESPNNSCEVYGSVVEEKAIERQQAVLVQV
jgi:6-pyruvoyltetrahydropterin/6-carboxytetrahydropterin synthase